MPDAKAGLVLEIDADASSGVGAGHLMRCAALAESWLDLGFGAVRFTGALDLPFAASRAVRLMARAAGRDGVTTALVTDTYDPVRREYAASRTDVRTRILVDDLTEPVPDGFDAIWNPSPRASPSDYPLFPGAVLAGPDVLPIRRGLPRWRGLPGPTAVLLGGGRPLSHVADALDLIAARSPEGDFTRLSDWMPAAWGVLDPQQPWTGIARCGRLVTGAGATLWEAAMVGIPVVVMLLAENQRRGFDWAVSAGVPGVDALAVRSPDALAAELSAALIAAAPLPLLHPGTERVARWVGALAGCRLHPSTDLRLRPATVADAYALWIWANDPATRAASFGRQPLEWSGHLEWLIAKLAEPTALLFIAESPACCPLGVIRLETTDGWATARLSYGLAPEVRGQGLGRVLVTAGLDALHVVHPGTRAHAEVATGNVPSLRIFRKLGWVERVAADRVVFASGRAG